MGLDKPGSFEMTYLKNFFEYAGFNTLIPRFNDSNYSDFTTEEKTLASAEDASTYVAYFYNNDQTTGVLKGLADNRSYSARLYNPLTGKFIDIANATVANGIYTIPNKPTTGDWALLVTNRDLGSYQTESPYADAFVQYNLALGVPAKVSSFNTGIADYSGRSAVDGNQDTYWCALNEQMPQWIKFDLGGSKTFNRFVLDLYDTNTQYTYTVCGSNDPSVWDNASDNAWNVLYDAVREIPDGARFTINIAEAEYRYLRVKFTAISGGHWGAIREFRVYRISNNELPVERPQYAGEKRYPLVTSIGSGVYTAAGVYSNTDNLLFDNNLETEWKPFAPFATQTILMDMQESDSLSGIVIMLGKNVSSPPQYRIEASEDGHNWTILVDATLREPQVFTVDRRTMICETLSGKYRFVKLLWLNGTNNTTPKAIREIELYVKSDLAGTGEEKNIANTNLKVSRTNRQIRVEVAERSTLFVYSSSGSLIDHLEVQKEQNITLPQGVYLLKSVSNGNIESMKIINY
jgi:hypothetical protein